STSTSTSSSTTSTLPCECGPVSQLKFTTQLASNQTGDVLNNIGNNVLNLNNMGLYIGGGAVALPLPFQGTDADTTVYDVDACSGTTLTLGPSTSAETGSNITCSSAGCLYLAPQPLVNPVTPLSTCVQNRVAQDASGSAMCDTGDVFIDL